MFSTILKETKCYNVEALKEILHGVKTAAAMRPEGTPYPRLVAVSKKQPLEKIVAVYNDGILHCGENYVQELHGKALKLELKDECPDIRWHFIGHLQSNKAKLLASVKNLWMVETIDREKVASALDRHWAMSSQSEEPLRVLVQVNTTLEGKFGCSVEEIGELAAFIRDKCPSLRFCGLMTLGRLTTGLPNKDFETLVKCAERIKKEFGMKELELSMGTSNNYKEAIKLGSTNIRVGSALLGERAPSCQ